MFELLSKKQTDYRILVVGDVMVDRYQIGTVDRISPEAPVPVLHLEKTEIRAGGAANVALNIAELSESVGILAVAARDDLGTELKAILENAAIKVHFQYCAEATICKTRIVANDQQICRVDDENKYSRPVNFLETLEYLVDDYDVVVLSDYAKGTLGNCDDIIELCLSKRKQVFVDPKNSNFSIYDGVKLLKPNLKEFIEATGFCEKNDSRCLSDFILEYHQKTKIEFLLVTAGADGMYYSDGEKVSHIAASKKSVYDVTGAGDTVISVISSFWNSVEKKELVVEVASSAAGLSVSKFGTTKISLSEMAEIYSEKEIALFKFPSLEFSQFVGTIDRTENKVVFTNGCFDLLHDGHIKLLREARRQGDILIVGLNSDASVSKLKGTDRPINSASTRSSLLSALTWVDYVVEFEDDTPLELIKEVSPDVLVKGSDYNVSEVVGYDQLSENGVVKLVDIVPGRSTTKIIQKIVG